MLVKISHYSKKLFQMGPAATMQILKNRVHNNFFYYARKRKALANRAHHSWSDIVRAHHAPFLFADYFEKRRQIKFPWITQSYAPTTKFPISLSEKPLQAAGDEGLMHAADAAANNCFDLLGSGPQIFTKIPWHTDVRLQAQDPLADCAFDAHSFYKDIVITQGETDTIEKDIKVPWELARFQYLFALGYAYQKTGDEKYAQTFVTHVQDWRVHNPFLLGINWVNPMEVALRSTNWLVAFDFFKHSPTISESFWQPFVCSLYDHWYYLEHNWELYDGVTSNHYLSDLVGYFYLCYFFNDLRGITHKRDWCYQELLREFDKQVFSEGADYEASTGYHVLVTELFFHFFALCEQQNLPVSADHKKKLERMFNFIQWCTPRGGSMVTIGDHDSGFVMHNGVTHQLLNKNSSPSFGVRHFKQFGLSVIKTKEWHVTLRHMVYQARQVTGHFHNDFGSITLAHNGVPILVDPGSYVYTPSAPWRNQFRSVAVHNTLFLEDIEPIALDQRLFFLNVQPMVMPDQDDSELSLYTEHDLYGAYGLRVKRQVKLDEQAGIITLADCFESIGVNVISHPNNCWNFTLAPDVEVAQHENNGWLFAYQGQPVMTLHSPDLTFTLHNTWVSPEYGQKVKTVSLRAARPTVPGSSVMIMFFKID